MRWETVVVLLLASCLFMATLPSPARACGCKGGRKPRNQPSINYQCKYNNDIRKYCCRQKSCPNGKTRCKNWNDTHNCGYHEKCRWNEYGKRYCCTPKKSDNGTVNGKCRDYELKWTFDVLTDGTKLSGAGRSHSEHHWFIANKGCALVQNSFRVVYTTQRGSKYQTKIIDTRRSKTGTLKKALIEAYAKSKGGLGCIGCRGRIMGTAYIRETPI